jgi:hypothetical protein
MAAETYYAGVYWFARRQSPEECARDTIVFLKALGQCDPCFASWIKSKRIKRKWTRSPLALEVDELAPMFARGVNRADRTRRVIEDLGFSISLLSPDLRYGPSLSVHVGAYSPFSHNYCVLDLPTSQDRERVLTEPVMADVMRCMARSWNPDWGIATSSDHRDLVDEEEDGVSTGWLMYFSRRWGTVPPLLAPVRIEPIEDRGTLVVLTPERLTASNPEHVELGRTVRKLLAKAGLLDRRSREPRAPSPG